MNVEVVLNLFEDLDAEISKVIYGQQELLRLATIALLVRSSVLLESAPGTAKTLFARSFARALSLDFKRIQFTPDLMPGDVIGTNIFNFNEAELKLVLGPIFTDILLADEINRTPPKTQAALLEAMNERTVTIDGETHSLGENFMVLATQNPLEHQGTYPLPEAQLDRFIFKHIISFPEREQEIEIIKAHGLGTGLADAFAAIEPVAGAETLNKARATIDNVQISDEIVEYIAELARASRDHSDALYGISPRAAVMLAKAARVHAAMDARDYVVPDDVKDLVKPLFCHRVFPIPGAEIDGRNAETIVSDILSSVPSPK